LKKIISVILFMVTLIFIVTAYGEVKIPYDVMNEAVANNDAGLIIQEYLYPFLESNEVAAILFASELNISNGCPFIRNLNDGGWGERAMFGKLIASGTVMNCIKNNKQINPNMNNEMLANYVRAETYRLLFGEKYKNLPIPNQTGMLTKWLRGGNTTFKFYYRHMSNGTVLNYSTGKFVKNTNVIWCIQITHTTEYYGEHRRAYIACDWKHEKDGFYTASFEIIR
jgi:hypothetical protein